MNSSLHSEFTSASEHAGKPIGPQVDTDTVHDQDTRNHAENHAPEGSNMSQANVQQSGPNDKGIRIQWDWHKNKKTSTLHHLMLNPASYIHQQRLHLSLATFNRQQQAVINRILLKRYALDVASVETNQLNKPTQWVVQHWKQLRQIAFLMACQRSRATLARGGLLLKLPNWARQFALLPLRDSSAQSSIHLSTDKILALGLSELLSWEAYLPSWLMQRILLLLPSEHEVWIQNLTRHAITPDLNLFLLAAQHAKNHYDPSFANIA